MRLFTGIKIDPDYCDQLLSVKKINKHLASIRWTKKENIHITSLFIGNRTPLQLDTIQTKLSAIANSTPCFNLELTHIGYSPGKNPSMIWAYLSPNAEFSRLHKELGIKLANKHAIHQSIMPHITLARIKKESKFYKPIFPPIEGIIPVNKIVLWESKLNKAGAKYYKVNEFQLIP